MTASRTIALLEMQIKSDPYNPGLYIELARAFLDKGDEERARRIVATRRKLPSRDPSIHLQWGRLAEELGMAAQARDSYELAVSMDPTNAELHYRTALLHYEHGGWERALKHLKRTVLLAPENEEARSLLASLYEEMGFGVLAQEVKKASRGDSPPLVQSTLEGPSGRDISILLNLFRGKEFGYTKFGIGPAGDLFFEPVDGVMGDPEVLRHLSGEAAYGTYPLRSDKTLRYCAFRVFIPWRRILENIKNSGFLAISESHVQGYARKIMRRATELGLPAYLEDPGDRERRVWFFFEEFIPVDLASRFLSALWDQIPAPDVDLSTEMFVGYKASGIGHREDSLPLPLGLNPRTGRRSLFLREDGEPVEDQWLFLRKMRTLSRKGLKTFLHGGSRGLHPAPLSSRDDVKRLRERCQVLNEILKKARSGRNLRLEEKRVLFFILGFLPDGREMLHHVLEPCPDYRPKKLDQLFARLGSHPISCPKVRYLLPEITGYVRCDCTFRLPPGFYPNPLLHLKSETMV